MLVRPARWLIVPTAVLLLIGGLSLLPATGEARDALRARPENRLPSLTSRRAFHFVLERDGEVFGVFAHASGLGSEHDVVEFREGGDEGVVRKLPGVQKFENIVLKRGITSDLAVWDWHQQVADDFPSARSDLSISMVGPRGGVHAVWNFQNAWPVKVTGPSPKADSNEIGIEELTIVHERMTRVQ